MTTKTPDALRRADRAIVGAIFLVLATAGAAIGYAPYTEKTAAMPSLAQKMVAETTQVRPQSAGNIATPRATARVSALELAMMQFLAERRCLAEAMYYEARGEGKEGQRAVAEVIFHRMRTAGYPGTICGVVYQGANLRHSCQFSFTCDGEMRRARNPAAWARSKLLAARIMTGAEPLGDLTADATSYHAVDVEPGWADTMVRTVQIGNHIFYRRAPRTREM